MHILQKKKETQQGGHQNFKNFKYSFIATKF